jgi:hypothetical protein
MIHAVSARPARMTIDHSGPEHKQVNFDRQGSDPSKGCAELQSGASCPAAIRIGALEGSGASRLRGSPFHWTRQNERQRSTGTLIGVGCGNTGAIAHAQLTEENMRFLKTGLALLRT